MRARIGLLCLALVGSVGLTACGDGTSQEDRLLAALRNSEDLAARYVYSEQRPPNVIAGTPAFSVEVKGLEEDDFRYKARVAIDGTDRYDEVVHDDALVMRFIDPTLLSRFVNRSSNAPLQTNVAGLSVIEALRTRRWVLDPFGAPAPVAPTINTTKIGTDPVVDGRSVLAYTEQAVKEALGVRRWDPEATQPAYLSFEDDFPKPESGSGVTRYDLVRPPVPPPGNLGASGDSSVPQTRHFRKMAIYVKDNRVIQIREDVSLKGKAARDFAKYMRTFMRESEAPEEFVAEFEEGVSAVEDDSELGEILLATLNTGLGFAGQDSVLTRTMSYDLQETDDIVVELPGEDVVEGSLALLVVSGHSQRTSQASDDPAAGPAGAAEGDGTGDPQGAGGSGGAGSAGDGAGTPAPGSPPSG